MAKLNEVPFFIAAPTREDLISLMLATNARYMHQMQYFDIQFVNNEWTAWYYFDAIKVRGK